MYKHPGTIILSPRITEKGAYLSESGVYVFNVAPRAGKKEVAEAILQIFKVMPRKVTIVPVPGKRVATRGASNRMGNTAGGKKAYVHLKKGDKIEIV